MALPVNYLAAPTTGSKAVRPIITPMMAGTCMASLTALPLPAAPHQTTVMVLLVMAMVLSWAAPVKTYPIPLPIAPLPITKPGAMMEMVIQGILRLQEVVVRGMDRG